jgi:hypothetical protein
MKCKICQQSFGCGCQLINGICTTCTAKQKQQENK